MEAEAREIINEQKELSVVIPAYLEEENLRLLLPRIVDTVREISENAEILVVDTIEPLDNTQGVCEKHKVTYLRRQGDNSFGAAVRTGINNSKGEFVVFMDADGSHSPSFIKKLFSDRSDYDVVIASRYVPGGYTENNRVLSFMSRTLNLTYRIVLNLNCSDVSNSFKLYRGDQLRSLKLKCSNFDIVEEILVKLNQRYRIRIKEIPFTFRKRMFGDTKRNLPLFIITYLYTLLRLRFS